MKTMGMWLLENYPKQMTLPVPDYMTVSYLLYCVQELSETIEVLQTAIKRIDPNKEPPQAVIQDKPRKRIILNHLDIERDE